MELELIKLKHNSPEWLEFRKNGLGGSDAAAAIGISPFKTNVQLWEEKVGLRTPEDISEEENVKYGNDAEDLLLKLFALDIPQYTVKSNKEIVYKRGFMFASLDGEIVDKKTNTFGLYEGKTSCIDYPSGFSKWNKQIPDYYYCQILHNLIVTGWTFAFCKAQLKHTGANGQLECITRHYPYLRKDILDDMQYLYLKEKEFWSYVERKIRPPLILPRINRE